MKIETSLKNMVYQKDEIWPGIVSVLAPLIQLVVVFSASLSGILNIRNFFIFPELLNLINFLTLFFILSFTGIFWYWRNNSIIVNNLETDKNGKQVYISSEKKIYDMLKILIPVTSIFFLTFIVTLFSVLYETYIYSKYITAVIQYISYSGIIITSGFIIYVWIYEYIRKQQTFQREDFLRNLSNTLNTHGLVQYPTVKIWKNLPASGYVSKIIWVEINDIKYVVVCSFDGLEISEIYEEKEYIKLTTPNS